MDQLINVIRKSDGKIAVNARDLHRFLEVKTPFNKWFPRMVKEYGFAKGTDFTVISTVDKNVHGTNGRFKSTRLYVTTLDCAKEITMVQKNKRGRDARRYFIHIQEAYKRENPVRNLMNAPKSKILAIAANAQSLYEKNLPKVHYYDKSMRNPGTMTATVIAKDFGMSATQLNDLLEHYGIIYRQGRSWVLYAKYQGMKLGSYASYNYGGNHYVNELWKWNQHGKKFIHDLLNSHGYLLNSEQLNLLNDKSNKNNRKRGYYANKNLHTGHRY